MGITAMTLNAMIKLDDSEFKSKLSGAEDKCKGFGDKLKKVGSGIAKVGKAAGVAIGAAAVLGVLLRHTPLPAVNLQAAIRR